MGPSITAVCAVFACFLVHHNASFQPLPAAPRHTLQHRCAAHRPRRGIQETPGVWKCGGNLPQPRGGIVSARSVGPEGSEEETWDHSRVVSPKHLHQGFARKKKVVRWRRGAKSTEDVVEVVHVHDDEVDGTAVTEDGEEAEMSREMEVWLDESIAVISGVRGSAEAVTALQERVRMAPDGAIPSSLFTHLFSFGLDDFQLDALSALSDGMNVIVSAPTGSGKTVAGELAIYYALALGLRVFYTTPLKALSNQKFNDFRAAFGAERVGLLTGDSGINRDASVVVMTTEVFRNMLYEGGSEEVKDVFAVVFDEFHYMNDPSRGTVWEESVIACPPSIQMVALSATVSNVADIWGWFQQVHGPTRLVTSDFRPVPLQYFYATRDGVFQLFRDAEAGPGARRSLTSGGRRPKKQSRKLLKGHELNPDLLKKDVVPKVELPKGLRPRPRTQVASFPFLVRALRRNKMLPAIVFVFSRYGCESAGNDVLRSELSENCDGSLLSKSERSAVKNRLAAFQDSVMKGVELSDDTLAMLECGVGVHHAGMLPLHKSFVESLFNDGLLKVCFATETLAAGINMPARTTVISVLSKRNAVGVGPLSVSSLLQMAGRAGRRGKDTKGSVVLMRSRYEDAPTARDLLLQPIEAVDSHFRSSYGMVGSVLRSYTLAQAEALVERSFGSYLAYKNAPTRAQLTALEGNVEELEDALAGIIDVLEGGIGPNDDDGDDTWVPSISVGDVRQYDKLVQRIRSERRIEKYLVQQRRMESVDVVESLVPFLRTGTAMRLYLEDVLDRDQAAEGGDTGDVSLVPNNLQWLRIADQDYALLGLSSDTQEDSVIALGRDGSVVVAHVERIYGFDTDDASGLPPKVGARALELITSLGLLPTEASKHEVYAGIRRRHPPLGEIGTATTDAEPGVSQERLDIDGGATTTRVPKLDEAWALLRKVGSSMQGLSEDACSSFMKASGDVLHQRDLIDRLESELVGLPLHTHPHRPEVMKAAKHLGDVEARLGKARKARDRELRRVVELEKRRKESKVWAEFLAVRHLLHRYNALQSSQAPDDDAVGGAVLRTEPLRVQSSPSADLSRDTLTEFGKLVSSINADNELWLGLVLSHPAVMELPPVDLAAVISAVITDYSRPDLFTLYGPSETVMRVTEELQPEAEGLLETQLRYGLDIPVRLDPRLSGLVESWAGGCEWPQLVASTSLDQGDLTRVFRRLMEVLRGMSLLPDVPKTLRQRARAAVDLLDRTPVTDDAYLTMRPTAQEGEELLAE